MFEEERSEFRRLGSNSDFFTEEFQEEICHTGFCIFTVKKNRKQGKSYYHLTDVKIESRINNQVSRDEIINRVIN